MSVPRGDHLVRGFVGRLGVPLSQLNLLAYQFYRVDWPRAGFLVRVKDRVERSDGRSQRTNLAVDLDLLLVRIRDQAVVEFHVSQCDRIGITWRA